MRALDVNAMTEKCVKGYIVASIVEDLRSALEQGRIDSDCVDLVLESTLGFMAALARRSAGPEVRVTLERPAPGHARFVFERTR